MVPFCTLKDVPLIVPFWMVPLISVTLPRVSVCPPKSSMVPLLTVRFAPVGNGPLSVMVEPLSNSIELSTSTSPPTTVLPIVLVMVSVMGELESV